MLRTLRAAALGLAITMASGGVALAQGGYGYADRGDYGWGRQSFRVARDIGYQDGARVGREDFFRRKPYDPYPRGKYSHADRGFRREYGDRYQYRDQYARAYQAGYRSSFGQRY
jgi:hypothetical protein